MAGRQLHYRLAGILEWKPASCAWRSTGDRPIIITAAISRTRVALAEDDVPFREGLANLLERALAPRLPAGAATQPGSSRLLVRPRFTDWLHHAASE
jgi:hypothetical protein